MCRTVKTVKALWQEWTVGLGHGNPSVAALDSRWGSQWRAGRQSEVQWYSLRLEVIKETPNSLAILGIVAQFIDENRGLQHVNLALKEL